MVTRAPMGSAAQRRGRWRLRLTRMLGAPRLRLAAMLLTLPLLSLITANRVPRAATGEPNLTRALSLALLRERALRVVDSDVHWVDAPTFSWWAPWRERRAVVRAKAGDDPVDVYLVFATLSPEGRLLSLDDVFDVSDTSAVDEQQLTVSGESVAWTVNAGKVKTWLHLADLGGAPLPSSLQGGSLARWQHRLRRLQETGQLDGIGRRDFRLDPPVTKLEMSWSGHTLLAKIEGHSLRIEPGRAPRGYKGIFEQPRLLGDPGNLITWAVDRVRAMKWFGSDRMQLLKAATFGWLDQFEQWRAALAPNQEAARLRDQAGAALSIGHCVTTDPESGWPPPPMVPVFRTPLPGEGVWKALDDDPFVSTSDSGQAAFLFAFLRPDLDRRYTQTFYVLWDPRQVELHAMSGTREPKSATGATGPGEIPRRPEVMSRLAAAFNGGFQAVHGQFGMMAEGVVYLPPKPYAATVAELSDGSTAFGTWPENTPIPPDMLSLRQNLTPLVLDDRINPYHRSSWGGVPPDWDKDETRTVRTGLCLTREGFVAFVYGSSLDPEHLGLSMLRARCVYGIHLDMNPGHTGLEFYRVAPTGQLDEPARKLDPEWEASGQVEGMPGWRFLARRMIHRMNLMHFPRYIGTESRDFFYLVRRHLLPLPPLKVSSSPAQPGEGQWKTQGLNQHGWPPVVASTWIRPIPSRTDLEVILVAVDAKWLQPPKLETNELVEDAVVASLPAPERPRGPSLFWDRGRFVRAVDAPNQEAIRLFSGSTTTAGFNAVGATGLIAGEIFVYAEVTRGGSPARDGDVLQGLLQQLGCHDLVFLQRPLGMTVGAPTRAPSPKEPRLVFVRGQGPGPRRIFENTPVVPVKKWHPLQSGHSRYLPPQQVPSAADSPSAGVPAPETAPTESPTTPEATP